MQHSELIKKIKDSNVLLEGIISAIRQEKLLATFYLQRIHFQQKSGYHCNGKKN